MYVYVYICVCVYIYIAACSAALLYFLGFIRPCAVIAVWCYYVSISLVWWCVFYVVPREERETTEDSAPVPLYWKADTKSIHQLDDGIPTKSFSYGEFISDQRPSSDQQATVQI